MLSGIREHQSTLGDSQRFYYNNYQYYNDYEDLEKDYVNDLSKIRFNLRRKSKTSIVLYSTHSSSYVELPTERLVQNANPRPTAHCPFVKNQNHTLDDLLFKFSQAYFENNYSESKPQRERQMSEFQIIILEFMEEFFQEKFSNREQQQYQNLGQVLRNLKQVGQQTRGELANLYQQQGRVQTDELLERWHAFQEYWNYLIEAKLEAESKNDKVENFYLFEFCQYFKYYFNEVRSDRIRSLLLLAQPETSTLSQGVHPLSVPLSFTFQKDQNPPRILFLNLDGRETYLNLKAISSMPDNIRYISIYREPNAFQLSLTKLTKQCEDFCVDAEFVNMNDAHSELLLRAASGGKIRQNTFLYPLNSIYLRRTYSRTRDKQPIGERRLPILETSADILWLWQEVIASQAQQWSPDITIISYNGCLNLNQEDFGEILKDLSIISDHRLILFTNMTGLFKPREDQMDEEGEPDYPMEKIELVQDFLHNYVPYKYEKVDEEKFFTNLSMFVKISSGAQSLKKRPRHVPQARYLLGHRLLYLERLSQLPEYADIMATGKQAWNIDRLFKGFAQRQIRENRKENETWERKIQQAVKQLMDLRDSFDIEEEFDEEMGAQQHNKWQRDRQLGYRLKQIEFQLQVEELLVHGQGDDVRTDLQTYISDRKQRLLLENLQSYHYRRVYTGQQQQRSGRLRCYRFCLNEAEGEEILLERYSQVIMDEKKSRIFIVNYRYFDERHAILQGEVSERGSFIRMKKVHYKLEDSIGQIILNSQRQIIHVNYSYCFAKDKLYLFWPQEWDINEEIKRKILGLQYSPPHAHIMLRIYYNSTQRVYLVESLKWKQSQGIPIIPRRGCIGVDIGSDNKFYIVGGVYDSRLDFYNHSGGVNTVNVEEKEFIITAQAKKKDKTANKSNILKPKINYKVQRSPRTSEDSGTIIISGGYGRSFTNIHSFFCYEGYNITTEVDGMKIVKTESKHPRLVKLSQPLRVAAVGKFYIGGQGEGEERFSDAMKDWVLAEGRQERAGQREVISVLEEQMCVKEFKSDHKRNYIFGWDRTIRQRIYVPHCWSPELQIIHAGRLYLVYTALKTEKSNNYNIGNFLIPKQEDLVSLCLDQDRLLLLSSSPVLHSLDNRPNNYFLYEGSLANMADLVTRRQLSMTQRYEFKSSTLQQPIRYKTIFTLDDRIFILGGLSKTKNEREDYILERNKEKLKRKIRRLQSADDSLELTSPVVVRYKDGFLLYSVVSEQKVIPKGEGAHSIEDYWQLKIQTFTPNESCQEESVTSGPLLLYHLDFEKWGAHSRRAVFQEPKIVKIIPYTKFSSNRLRDFAQKIYVKIARNDEERLIPYQQLLRVLIKERDQKNLADFLKQHHHSGSTFKQFLALFDNLLDDEKKQRENLENEELVRDLRSLSSLLNKHLLESVLEPQSDTQLYKFVIQDRSSRKVKYIAIGPLLTTRLRFLRIRYKHELSTCLNEANQEELFFNANVLACEQIARERLKGASTDWEEESVTKKITVTYKA